MDREDGRPHDADEASAGDGTGEQPATNDPAAAPDGEEVAPEEAEAAGAGPDTSATEPVTRIDHLDETLSSIRQRVQSLSNSMERGPGAGAELSVYRPAGEDRTLAEVRRYGSDTQEVLRRMSGLMQDLTLDLRSIVDATRRAILQASEQAGSGAELSRVLGGRIEELGSGVAQLLDRVDRRLTRLEQRAGVGMVREEMHELRSDVGETRTDIGALRQDIAAVVGAGTSLEPGRNLGLMAERLDQGLDALRDLVEGVPEQDQAVVDQVVSAMRSETEAAVAPFRSQVEELAHRLDDALGREGQLGEALATLTEEVKRLRRRIAVSGPAPQAEGDQFQALVEAVAAAIPASQSEPRPFESVAEHRGASDEEPIRQARAARSADNVIARRRWIRRFRQT